MSAGVVVPTQILSMLDGASFGSLSSGLQKLGLKLEPVKAPLDVLVIDSVQRKPTDN
jgi:uncharacterized protein (TIGR03435 family)